MPTRGVQHNFYSNGHVDDLLINIFEHLSERICWPMAAVEDMVAHCVLAEEV